MDLEQKTMQHLTRRQFFGRASAGIGTAALATLFQSEGHASNTIHKYQKGKHVMAEPQILPLRSPMSFAAGKREVDCRAKLESAAVIPKRKCSSALSFPPCR